MMMFDIEKALCIMNEISEKVMEINSTPAFMAFVGTLVDAWAEYHGISLEDMNEMLNNLVDARLEVRMACGPMFGGGESEA